MSDEYFNKYPPRQSQSFQLRKCICQYLLLLHDTLLVCECPVYLLLRWYMTFYGLVELQSYHCKLPKW